MEKIVKIGLVGCVAKKRKSPALAKNLYISPLFLKRREYVERYYDSWYILSAKYHMISPEELLEPYDETLKQKSASERRNWSKQVFSQISTRYPNPRTQIFYFHAGADYQKYLNQILEARGYQYKTPLKGLRIGEQLAWYGENL